MSKLREDLKAACKHVLDLEGLNLDRAVAARDDDDVLRPRQWRAE